MVFSPKKNIVEWYELSRAEVGKEVNEVWSKPLISFQRLPKVVGTWCKAFMSSPPLLYILKTMDPRQQPRPPRSYHSIWQGCEVLTSEGCSEVMCLRWLADHPYCLQCAPWERHFSRNDLDCTNHTFSYPCWHRTLLLTSAESISPGPHDNHEVELFGTIRREQMCVGQESSASSRQEYFQRNGGRAVSYVFL